MDNGISWIELGRFTGPANDSGFQAASFDLSPYVSGFLTTSFITSAKHALTKARFYVDNVQVSHTDHRPYTNYPQLVDAADLHLENTLGSGVTIAVVDTGYWAHPDIAARPEGAARALLLYDAMQNVGLSALPTSMVDVSYTADESGHGSHVTSIAVSSGYQRSGWQRDYNGVAPGATLLSVKAFDGNGQGSYLDIIRGIDWVVTHRNQYNIRVLNLSFSAAPQSYYWEDPLNQAVMRAWQAGIVVVAAAGNQGPDPMTIGVPGNVPYIITVGAMSDNDTPNHNNDDFLASFSSTGPTVEGFVKPDLLAPGGHMLGLMPGQAARSRPPIPSTWSISGYFSMSGTSQATAVVSGVAALLLQGDPGLTPDDVKCQLMAAARPAMDDNGDLAYSVFQQGAGLANAYAAANSDATACANQGLNVDAELTAPSTYGGWPTMTRTG